MVTMTINTVQTAFISGVTPRLTFSCRSELQRFTAAAFWTLPRLTLAIVAATGWDTAEISAVSDCPHITEQPGAGYGSPLALAPRAEGRSRVGRFYDLSTLLKSVTTTSGPFFS